MYYYCEYQLFIRREKCRQNERTKISLNYLESGAGPLDENFTIRLVSKR